MNFIFLFLDVFHHVGLKYALKLSTMCKQVSTKGTFKKMKIVCVIMHNISNFSIYFIRDSPVMDIQCEHRMASDL